MSKSQKETSPLLRLEKGGGFDLWREHARALKSWDDLLLSRWLNQMLGHLHEVCWRASHPLVVSYRLGATVAYQRDIWNRQTFSVNSNYQVAACCGAPCIPFVSFEVCTHGIYCSCCGEVLETLEDMPNPIANVFRRWGKTYDVFHQVAHWTEEEQKRCSDYDTALDKATQGALPLLGELGYQLAPRLLARFPSVMWEDADNCLDIIPEDIIPAGE
jgi:hypothetical protein